MRELGALEDPSAKATLVPAGVLAHHESRSPGGRVGAAPAPRTGAPRDSGPQDTTAYNPASSVSAESEQGRALSGEGREGARVFVVLSFLTLLQVRAFFKCLKKKYFTFLVDSSENLNVLNGQVSIFSSRKARPCMLKRYF